MPEGLIWGAGPVVQTAHQHATTLGNKNWGLGPSGVVLQLEHGDPWVYGVLVNNVWSLTSDKRGGAYSNGMHPAVRQLQLPGRLLPDQRADRTVNWKADSGQQWTVPLGGGIGKIFHLGRLPVNTQLSAYYNVVRPDYGPNWQVRAQVQFMFPK